MFVFEDLLEIDDRGIQELLREVDTNTLVLALKAAVPAMREKFLSNMSQRAAEMLKDDLESRGPVKLSEVETSQKLILKTVRKLAEDGRIILQNTGEEFV
jgi:flagellar motor switch protein FliG